MIGSWHPTCSCSRAQLKYGHGMPGKPIHSAQDSHVLLRVIRPIEPRGKYDKKAVNWVGLWLDRHNWANLI
jgi:hypothetical protein